MSLTITEFLQLFGYRKQSATMSARKVSRTRKSGLNARELVLQAVGTSMERKGLSSAAVMKILAAQGYDVDKNKARVKTAIRTLVKKGALVRTTGAGPSACFRMTSKPVEAKRRAGKKSRRRPKKAKATRAKRRAGKKSRRRPRKAKGRRGKKRAGAKKTSKRRRKAPKRRRRVVRKASGKRRASAKKATRRRRRAASKRK